MARLRFWGAARTVTGSMHLLESGPHSVLLDCGLFQGRRKQAFERNRTFPFRPKEIDCVLLSHAHIDHCGNLPGLVRAGFAGPIYTTAATADLARVLLMDSAEIQEADVDYINRDRRRQGQKAFEPLYTVSDARRTLARFETVDYLKPTEVLPGLTGTWFDAGHMLGSASISIRITEPAAQPVTLVFSGDIGRNETPILRDPEFPDGADFVLMESTYGDRLHPPRQDIGPILRHAVHRVFSEGGILLIPAFSVGRTQEVIYRLNELSEEDRLPDLPVFIDSPMANEAMEVFRRHPECFDDETVRRISTESDRDPLGFRHLQPIRTADQSRRLNDFQGPCVIIAASGMCESGRILHHLKHHVSKPNTIVLFAGFQAPDTLGRKILEGRSPVSILGRQVDVRASVERLEGLSGHADQGELLGWLSEVRRRGDVKGVALVHGEVSSAEALADHIKRSGLPKVQIPEPGDEWDLRLG